jgi:hypothetical protein
MVKDKVINVSRETRYSQNKAVNNFRVPENPTEVKSFLGLVYFCAKYIRDFATLAEPLRKLTRKEVKIHAKSFNSPIHT